MPVIQQRSSPTAVALVARFRRQRPLRAGSLLVTILGDAIAPRGGSIALQSLIRLATPFGLTERLVRTSVGRLAQDGWLEASRRGRLGYYRLNDYGRARFAEATLRIYQEAPAAWDGRWTVILAPVHLRERVRQEMAWLGFGQVMAGVLAHPARDLEVTRTRLEELGVLDDAIVLQATTIAGTPDRRLVEAGWDLRELTSRYERFVAMFQPAHAALCRGRATPAEYFLVRTLLIHEYRKIQLRDPLLPASLLPPGWVGAIAYALCRNLYRLVFWPSESYLSQAVETDSGALPAPSREVFARFGGLPRD